MAIFIVGIVVLAIGIAMTRNTALDRLLKEEDYDTWKRIMSPSEKGYVNSFGTIQLFTWILSRGYETSSSSKIQSLGSKSMGRANTAKYLMILGILFVVAGFFVALLLSN